MTRFGFFTPTRASHVLGIPHVGTNEDGSRVNYTKYRDCRDPLPEGEDRWKWGKGYEQDKGVFWNADMLDDPEFNPLTDMVVITEAALDGASVWQAGHPWVMGIPHGGRDKMEDESEALDPAEDAKFNFIWKHWEKLKLVKRFLIWMDKDTAGHCTAAALVRRLGKERCWQPSDIPAGCKDANDVLRKHGDAGVMQVVLGAKPYPLEGDFGIDDIPDRPPITGLPMFHPSLTRLMRIVWGKLGVLTGYPSHGKSTILYNVIGHMIEDRALGGLGLTIAVGCFETDIKPTFYSGLMAAMMGTSREQTWTHGERSRIHEVIKKRVRFIVHADRKKPLTMEHILDLGGAMVERYGIRVMILDTWNKIDHRRDMGENETDYTGRMLGNARSWAEVYEAFMLIVAHPKAPSQDVQAKVGNKGGLVLPRPNMYSISGCYSDDTEVLTRRGWLRHADIAHDDEVACFDPDTSTTVYARPSRIIRKRYAGDMHAFKGYGYDLLVTPEHRMVVKPCWPGEMRRWPKGKWSFCEARDLPSARFVLPLAAKREGGVDEITPNMAALAGWYVSEGAAQSAGVSISQAQGEKADQIAALLAAMSIPFTINYSKPGGKGGKLPMQAFYIGKRAAEPVVSWLRRECGVGSANKRIPAAVLDGSEAVREAFLAAFLAGDGSFRVARGTHSACTTSPQLRDDLQRLAVELGYSCCWTRRAGVSARHAPSWHLNIGTNGRTETAIRRHRNRSIEPYDGYVWCLTVPTGAYIVRRNGRATICGNSAHWYNAPDYGAAVFRPDLKKNLVEWWQLKVRDGMPGAMDMTELVYNQARSNFMLQSDFMAMQPEQIELANAARREVAGFYADDNETTH